MRYFLFIFVPLFLSCSMIEKNSTVLRDPAHAYPLSQCGIEYECVSEVVSESFETVVSNFKDNGWAYVIRLDEQGNEKWWKLNTLGKFVENEPVESSSEELNGQFLYTEHGKPKSAADVARNIIEKKKKVPRKYMRGSLMGSPHSSVIEKAEKIIREARIANQVSEKSVMSVFVNPSGDWVTLETSVEVGDFRGFQEGLAAVEVGRSWGYIDASGWAIEPTFSLATDFSEGWALIRTHEGKYGYVNRSGSQITYIDNMTSDRFSSYEGEFSDGLSLVVGSNSTIWRGGDRYYNLLGFVGRDPWGWKISPKYIDAQPFSEGFAAVREKDDKRNSLWKYINTNGIAVNDSHFKAAGSFQNGLALVQDVETRKFGYIDHKGRWVIEPAFENAYSFYGNVALVLAGGKWKLIRLRRR